MNKSLYTQVNGYIAIKMHGKKKKRRKLEISIQLIGKKETDLTSFSDSIRNIVAVTI